MRLELLLDVLLVLGGALVAFFVPSGSRKGSTWLARALAVLVPVALVAYSQYLWANEGRGLLDKVTCAIAPSSRQCSPEKPEVLTGSYFKTGEIDICLEDLLDDISRDQTAEDNRSSAIVGGVAEPFYYWTRSAGANFCRAEFWPSKDAEHYVMEFREDGHVLGKSDDQINGLRMLYFFNGHISPASLGPKMTRQVFGASMASSANFMEPERYVSRLRPAVDAVLAKDR